MQTTKHRERHEFLNSALDELVGDFIAHTHHSISKTTVAELMWWSHEQSINPTEKK